MTKCLLPILFRDIFTNVPCLVESTTNTLTNYMKRNTVEVSCMLLIQIDLELFLTPVKSNNNMTP